MFKMDKELVNPRCIRRKFRRACDYMGRGFPALHAERDDRAWRKIEANNPSSPFVSTLGNLRRMA
jgi:hypothetical protein